MNKKQTEVLQTLVTDMLKSFKEDFFQKYLATIEVDLGKEDAEYMTLNLLFSFAVSAFLNIVMPVLMSAENKDKAIADAETLLKDLRISMMTGLKGHTPIGKIVN